MLGVTIRFDTFLDAEDNLCRVLHVEPNSPAELAGLIPGRDYLLGTAERVFKDTDTLYEELSANVDTPVEFYVYNADTDEVRIVVIMPSEQWGGEKCGLLGADVAHGYLHGLPSDCCRTIGISSVVATKSLCSPFGLNDAAVLTGTNNSSAMAGLTSDAPHKIQLPASHLETVSPTLTQAPVFVTSGNNLIQQQCTDSFSRRMVDPVVIGE
jgi:GRASP55/65 PDZ-like domain